MRPKNLKTKIFLDSGNPDETKEIIQILGFLDGQTTNPSLVVKNPGFQEIIRSGKKLSQQDVLGMYKDIVVSISGSIPTGSVSIEVPIDVHTTVDTMYDMGKEMFSWIPNAHIKYPIIPSALEAAERLVHEGARVNMTLCFSQQQAAAVHLATKFTNRGDVFISPFVGRLCDRNEDGMKLVRNILEMYRLSGSRVEVLAASIRSIDHLHQALEIGADIVTAPFAVLKEWGENNLVFPHQREEKTFLKDIPYVDIDLSGDWRAIDMHHELTDAGLKRFSDDWSMIANA